MKIARVPYELIQEIQFLGGIHDGAGTVNACREAESVDPDVVAEFFMSPFRKRILSMHDSVHRETAFTIEIKCSKVLKPEPVPGLRLRSGISQDHYQNFNGAFFRLRLKLQPRSLSNSLAWDLSQTARRTSGSLRTAMKRCCCRASSIAGFETEKTEAHIVGFQDRL